MGAVTRRENPDFELTFTRIGYESEEEEHNGHAEGDAARPMPRGDSELRRVMKEMTNAWVQTIRESNQTVNQNINTLLGVVRSGQSVEQPASASVQHRGNRLELGRRPRPNRRSMFYNRYGYSDSDDERNI